MPRPKKGNINTIQDQQRQPFWKNRHFWIITVLIGFFTVFYYTDPILDQLGWESLKWSVFYTVHDLHRTLFLIPVFYAAWVFRTRGVIISTVLLLAIFLPRAIWFSPYPDPLLRALVFVSCFGVVGYLLAVFLDNNRERKTLEENLLKAQKGLLRETHDYLECLINCATAPILAWDREQRITEFNTAFERLMGYSSAEILGKPLWVLFPEDSRVKSMTSIRQTLEGRRWESEEIPILRKDGTVGIVLWNSANIFDQDGQTLVTTIAQGQDITALKQTEAKSKEESLWRRLLTDQSRDGIVVLDNQGRVYETNQQFAHMLGYTPEEMRYLAVWDWEYLITRDKLLEMIRTVDEKGDHFETRHRRKDGSVYDVEISTNGAQVSGQKLIFCVCRDITDRKKADELLRQSEAKYAALVEQSNDSILIIENGILRFVNSKAIEASGLPQEALLGHCFTDFLPPEQGSNFLDRHLKRMAGENVSAIFETELVRPDGNRIPVEINANITVFQGRPAVMAIMRNISERKLAESRKIEMEALKRVDTAKSEFLGNVSHELRTPLSSVKGFIETLLEPDLKWSEKQKLEFLRAADFEVDRLNLLINDLLDMSRIDSGRLILDRRSHQVIEVVESVSGVLNIIALNHRLKIHPIPDLPPLWVDKSRIGQVITNLVDNAAKFSAEGSHIEIEIRPLNGEVIFSVVDHGIGMTNEVLASLFDRFYQAKQVVDGKTRGTGLGLTICKGIVEAHGGRIWVESKPGKGSRIQFSLPHKSQ